MAIDAKVSFLREMEQKGAEIIPQAIMQHVLQIASDVLEGFDMRELSNWAENDKDDLLDGFIASMKVQGRSKGTIDRYDNMIRRFMTYAKAPTRRISAYHVRNWLAMEKEKGLQDSTLEGMRQILSSYFGWLFREALIERNPMCNIGTIKVPKKQKQIYSEVDMVRMLNAAKKARDKTIIHFLASTGCRVSEMIQLNRDDVDLVNKEVVVHGKGNKERVVYFDSVTAMMLQRYLKRRKDKDPALFVGRHICSDEDVRLQANGVRVMLKGIEKRTGIKIHPHKFRRTFASDCAKNGMPIQMVCSLLGHERIDTTMTYVVQDREDVKSSYRRYA